MSFWKCGRRDLLPGNPQLEVTSSPWPQPPPTTAAICPEGSGQAAFSTTPHCEAVAGITAPSQLRTPGPTAGLALSGLRGSGI